MHRIPPFFRSPQFAGLILLALAVAGAQSHPSDGAAANPCKPLSEVPETRQEPYPALPRSPLESVQDHDLVFFGEVVVPTKPCSLGFCAGLRVLSRIKGAPDSNVLIRVMRPGEDQCAPDMFRHKGATWVVFANTGTSRTGYKYLHADYQGPSFASIVAPNFQTLEADYRMLRARLDDAIEARLGRRPLSR